MPSNRQTANWSHTQAPSPRNPDLSALCPWHHTHAIKYCPDVRPHLAKKEQERRRRRVDMVKRLKGLRCCLTCNDYFPESSNHNHDSTEEE